MPKIATCTLEVEHHEKGGNNVPRMLSFVDEAADQGANFIVFPESAVAGLGGSENPDEMLGAFNAEVVNFYLAGAEEVPCGPSTQAMIQKAAERDIYICWSMNEKCPGHPELVWNTVVLVGPEGFVGKYHKVHLPMCEQLNTVMGNEWPVFDTKFGKVGLMCCYDLSFPEAARSLAVNGAQIILCPTGWPLLESFASDENEDDRSLDLLVTWTRSRALENGVVVVTSQPSDLFYSSHGMVVDGMGKILANTGFGERVSIADLGDSVESKNAHDRSYVMYGALMHKDRRPDTYSAITRIGSYNFMNSTELQESWNR